MIAKDGWFAARLSGTEEIYKIFAEVSSVRTIYDRSRKKPRPLFRKRWLAVPRRPEPISHERSLL